MNLGKGHSLCFTRGKQCSNAQNCVLSDNWFLFISPPQSPEITVHLPFKKSTEKSKIQGKILVSLSQMSGIPKEKCRHLQLGHCQIK